MAKAIIKIKGVKKSYHLSNKLEVPVLRGVDLEILEKEFVAIMGESGGGKSTLMNIIGCLTPADSGSYFLSGEDIAEAKDDYTLAFIRNKKMGFIFQQFNLLNKMSALRNVALPGVYAGLTVIKREEKAKALLKQVGLGDRIHHKPSELILTLCCF